MMVKLMSAAVFLPLAVYAGDMSHHRGVSGEAIFERTSFRFDNAVLNPEWNQVREGITSKTENRDGISDPVEPVSVAAVANEEVVPNNDQVWIYAFYRDPGKTGIYLASSEDGLHFKPLNNDQPVMIPPDWPEKQNLTRDPSLIYHGGKFRVVWTSFGHGNCLGYAESSDLVTWSDPVKVEPFPSTLPPEQQPKNIWCSQICWDPVQNNYMINTTSRVGTNGQRIFLTRTPDCKVFGSAQSLLDPGFECMEGMMAFDQRPEGDRWVMFFKNEEPQKKGGKNLRFATAQADFSKPLLVNPKPVAGPGTNLQPQSMAEGPCLVKTKAGWNLYWDIPLEDAYGMASSTDLKNWVDHTDELKLPAHCRHGSFIQVPRSAVKWLK